MSSRNRKSNFSLIPEPLARGIGLLVGPARTPALAAVVVGLFAGAWWWSWQRVGADVLASDSYWLAPDDIVVSNEVDWIRSDDIRREVFHNASLESRLSIMDPELTERIAAAFSLHPWVARVRRVSKRHPAGLAVELEYRRPVCMVEAPGRLIPVDVEGNRLPDGDFALNQAVRFPRLTDIETMPVGPPGTRWGDLRVADGAAIAAALEIAGPHSGSIASSRCAGPTANGAPTTSMNSTRTAAAAWSGGARLGPNRPASHRSPRSSSSSTHGSSDTGHSKALAARRRSTFPICSDAAAPPAAPHLTADSTRMGGGSLGLDRRGGPRRTLDACLLLDLFAHNRHLRRSFDTDPNNALRHSHDSDRDLVADENSLSNLPG